MMSMNMSINIDDDEEYFSIGCAISGDDVMRVGTIVFLSHDLQNVRYTGIYKEKTFIVVKLVIDIFDILYLYLLSVLEFVVHECSLFH